MRDVWSMGLSLIGLCLAATRLNVTVTRVRDDSCCLIDRIEPPLRILTVLRDRFHSTTAGHGCGAD